MPFMDIFNADAFSVASMTSAIERVPTNPGAVGQLNLFTPNPIRTEVIGIEERSGVLNLIQTSNRGEPKKQGTTEKAILRYFSTSRIAKQDTIRASELAFVRQFGTEDQVKNLQSELARRMNGETGLLADVEYTKEHMKLGAIQGIVLDADSTPIINWFSEFNITPNTEINFLLATATDGALRENIQKSIIRPMRVKAQGARFTGVQALCSPEFFDALIKNPEVRQSFAGLPEQQWYRDTYDGRSFDFGGVEWVEYFGDDANADIAIPTNKCRFIPKGSTNIFEVAYSPAESFADIGTLGKEVYSKVNPDLVNDEFVDLWVSSYPLYICKRPDLLFSGRIG